MRRSFQHITFTMIAVLGSVVLVASAAAQAQVQVAGAGPAWTMARDREVVDEMDKTERMLVLTPAGPLVVQLELTVDGAPFRSPRERLVDQVLSSSDTDGDQQSTWAEALANPRFGFGRLAGLRANPESTAQVLKLYDLDGDGKLDRFEARQFLAMVSGGPTFAVSPYFMAQTRWPDLKLLLDRNQDLTLSAEELASASDLLARRDADTNEWLTVTELGLPDPGYGGAFVPATTSALVTVLGPTLDIATLHTLFTQVYRAAGESLRVADLPALGTWLQGLDANGNGELSVDELAAINGVAPQVLLAINIGAAGDLPAGMHLVSLAAELGSPEQVAKVSEGQITLRLAGVTVQFRHSDQQALFNYEESVKATMMAYDTDKNGYLELKELESQMGLGAQFEIWDANSDGKVFAEELQYSFDQQMAPQLTLISVMGANDGNALFATLDGNGDGRLGLREVRQARAGIQSLDINQDGQVDAVEVPDMIGITISRGAAYGGYPGMNVNAASLLDADTPDWFVRMDRNGDGDLSPQEFLGTPEQFSTLDANADGLVDQAEGKAAITK